MKTQSPAVVTTKAIELLEAAKNELEQFRAELSKDKHPEERYEVLKTEFKTSIKEMKEMIDRNTTIAKDAADSIRTKLTMLEGELDTTDKSILDDLRVHLANIKTVLLEIASSLNEKSPFNEILVKIHDRLHRSKIKFEIVKLKIALGQMEMKDIVKEKSHQLAQKINATRDFVNENEEMVEKKWKTFRQDVDHIYRDLQKVFTSK